MIGTDNQIEISLVVENIQQEVENEAINNIDVIFDYLTIEEEELTPLNINLDLLLWYTSVIYNIYFYYNITQF
jgi:hypothetical protein